MKDQIGRAADSSIAISKTLDSQFRNKNSERVQDAPLHPQALAEKRIDLTNDPVIVPTVGSCSKPVRQRDSTRWNYYSGWVTLLLIVIFIFVRIFKQKIRKYHRHIDALNENYEKLKARYNALFQEMIDNTAEKTDLLHAFEHLLVRFHNLLDRAYRVAGPKNYIKEFKDYATTIGHDKAMFAGLRYVVDKKYNGLISHLHSLHPNLTDYELDMLCMLRCGFSLDCIRLLHQHENTYSIYSRRTKIHKKLGLPPHKKIEEYLAELTEQIKCK